MTDSDTRLRRLMADELDHLPPMPDAVGDVRRRGRVARRRRRAGTGLVLAAAVAATALTSTQLIGDRSTEPVDGFADGPRAASIGAAPVSEEEWRAAVADTFDATLPERFARVVDAGSSRSQRFELVVDGEPRAWFHVAVFTQSPEDESPWGCAMVAPTDSCAEAKLTDGRQVTGYHDTTDDGSQTATLIVAYEDLDASVEILSTSGQPVPLSDQELVTIGRSADFADLVGLGVRRLQGRPELDRTYMTPTPAG